MKNSRFNEEQIIGILKESEAGAKISELCRQHGIGARTFYGWRSKYGGMEVSEAKRLKQLEEENSITEAHRRRSDIGHHDVKRIWLENGEPGGQEIGDRACA